MAGLKGAQLMRRRTEAGRLYLEGVPLEEIAVRLAIDKETACRDIQWARRQWQAATMPGEDGSGGTSLRNEARGSIAADACHALRQRLRDVPPARYVERNALRANLAERAEQWRWCSLAQRLRRQGLEETAWLWDWPVPRPRNWVALANDAQTEGELEALRRSVQRGCPFGDEPWQKTTAERLGLESTLRLRGRPRKEP